MFRPKYTVDWPIVLFSAGLVVVVVLVLTLFILFSAKAKKSEPIIGINQVDAIIINSEELEQNYKESIAFLGQALQSNDYNLEQTLADIDAKLFSTRVPQPYLDQHFSAVVAVRALIDNEAELSEKQVRDELDEIISKLASAVD